MSRGYEAGKNDIRESMQTVYDKGYQDGLKMSKKQYQKGLEADRTIEKTLYAIREEMQYIKVAELQIYGANSWRFSNAIEDIIDKHLEEVEDDKA